MRIVANMIVGAKPEPFLKQSIDSIIPSVHDIVIVANKHNANSDLLEHYANITVIYKDFVDFATARNTALDASTHADYILWVDVDEVHFTNGLKQFINETVEAGASIGKAAFYHFVKDMKHYQSIDERTILIKNGIFRWTKPVDEYPLYNKGTKANVYDSEYKYHHYGYTKPQRELWEGWMERAKILNEKDPWFEKEDPETILEERKLVEYTGKYPEVMA